MKLFRHKILLIANILCFILFLTYSLIIVFIDGKAVEEELVPAKMIRENGYCCNYQLSYSAYTDSEDVCASDLLLYENNDIIGAPHRLHDSIRTFGKGQYSHWKNSLYFSSSDNTDPVANGRKYIVRYSRKIPYAKTIFILSLLLLVLVNTPVLISYMEKSKRINIQNYTKPGHLSILRKKRKFRNIIFQNLFFFLVPLFIIGFFYYYIDSKITPSINASASAKQRSLYYQENAKEYNLIFMGDSRTYCGMHPHILDPMLGTNSLNLAVFSNWFPTQYPQFQDVLPYVPEDTYVVWSVGHQNFWPCYEKINKVYSIGVKNIPNYLRMGYSYSSISDNINYYNPFLKLYGKREYIRRDINNFFDRIFYQRGDNPHPNNANSGVTNENIKLNKEIDFYKNKYGQDPKLDFVSVTTDAKTVTSVVQYFDRGGYYRTEIQPDFFRKKQQEMISNAKPSSPPQDLVPDPTYWNNFIYILEFAKKNNIKLIVNEFEEGPHMYATPAHREAYIKFMDTVRKKVEEYGYSYIRIDFTKLDNSDYFDYNHLNSKGIDKFSKLFVKKVKPILNDTAK